MPLVEQSEIAGDIDGQRGWKREVFLDLKARIEPPSSFPCIFSQNAFRRDLLLFSFVEALDSDGLARSVSDLVDYVALSKEWDGRVDSARPLVVAFSKSVAHFHSLEEFHGFGWSVLQRWHDCDPDPWPGDVATDPNAPYWSMCFKSLQLFVNMSAPAHEIRKSRNLGEHFLFIVNPRERFDVVAGNTPEGWKVRNNIRQRVGEYDRQPHSLQLGSYKAGEVEWWQYGIIEDNVERSDGCPFRFNTQGNASHGNRGGST